MLALAAYILEISVTVQEIWRQENQEIKAILGYIANPRPTFAGLNDPVSKKWKKEKNWGDDLVIKKTLAAPA